MSRNVVADFTAFLAVTDDDEQLFEDGEGRVVMSRSSIVLAGDGTKRELPIEAVAEFDFRTVPPEWEGFFDDLVGVRFVDDGEEYTATIGTDAETADRFVTVLLKLKLDETETTVPQKQFHLDATDANAVQTETSFMLLPKSERITFDDEDPAPIDISTITGVQPGEDGRCVVVRHLSEDGRVATKLTPETAAASQFLETYLEFRTEIATDAGPIALLFVGADRDALVLVAKLLKHRKLEFEVTHARTAEEATEALAERSKRLECIVCASDFASAVQDELTDRGLAIPTVLFAGEDAADPPVDAESVVDVVTLGSRTAHYEDIADAIERAVLAARLDE